MANGNSDGNGGSPAEFISLDPDSASTYITTPLEDLIRSYKAPDDELEYKVYRIEGCYHLLPRLINGMSSYLRIPASKLTTCAIDIGVNNLTQRFGSTLDTINNLRGAALLYSECNWGEEEFLTRQWEVDFNTSRKRNWAVRLHEGVVLKADRLAAMGGFSLYHMRQVAIMAGVAQSSMIGGKQQQKIVGILREFGRALEHKAKVMKERFIEVGKKMAKDDSYVDNIWDVI